MLTAALTEIRVVTATLAEVGDAGPRYASMETRLEVRVGEAKTWLLVVELDGEPADLTDATIEWEVKRAEGDADPPLVAKSIGDGITLRPQDDAERGLAEIALEGDDTVEAPPAEEPEVKPSPGNYRHSVTVVLATPADLAGKRKIPIVGDLVVRGVVNPP